MSLCLIISGEKHNGIEELSSLTGWELLDIAPESLSEDLPRAAERHTAFIAYLGSDHLGEAYGQVSQWLPEGIQIKSVHLSPSQAKLPAGIRSIALKGKDPRQVSQAILLGIR